MTEKYEGTLVYSKMPKEVYKAYKNWRCQKSRCENPNDPSYPYYGAKGIKVEYSSRQFIAWWLNAIKNFKGSDPVTSRLDHSDNYNFSNIVLDSRVENSKERMRRIPRNKYMIDIYEAETNKLIATVSGSGEASRLTGVNTGTIHRYISGEMKKPKSLKFHFKKSERGVTCNV